MNARVMGAVCAAISAASGQAFAAGKAQQAAGGSIHQNYALVDGDRRYFVKTNAASMMRQFAAEADGLSRLAATGSVRVPSVVCSGAAEESAFLVLEHLNLCPATRSGQARLGRAIAALHGADAGAAGYGLDRDNFIGSTPQPNAHCADWTEFFRERRLRFQLDLAAQHGYGAALEPGTRLLERLDGLFAGYRPRPSLLHGDLWSGNVGELNQGAPVVFDPAVHIGDRESDLAMSELFGGFAPAFYAAYDETWQRDAGYAVRRTLYQLYHVLNHLNLFGSGYLLQAQRMIAELNAELG